MKLTIRNTKVRDDRGQMVGATFLGNGSIADEVDSWLTNNPDAIADAASQDVSDWLEDNITQPTNPVIDASLSVSGAAADAKKTGDAISDIQSTIGALSSIPHEVKLAMDTLFQNAAFKNTDVYTDELAIFHAWASSVNLISISVVYTQNRTVTNRDSLDSLKDGLVVTATYDDGTTATVVNYTLSGELAAGVCPVTVSYREKAATFTVNVTGVSVPSAYTEYDYMQVTSEQYTKATDTWMRLKKYANLNAVSCEFKFKSLPQHYAGGALFGHRSASGGASSFAFYSGDNVVGYHLHGADAGAISGYIPATTNEIHTVKYKNTAQSPSSLSVDDTTITINWVNNNTLNLDPVMFTNPIAEGSINILAFNQVGDLKFYDLEGTLINYYTPVVRTSDNVIGMYDMVEGTFYTPTTASVATVGNSNCFYAVGNWS